MGGQSARGRSSVYIPPDPGAPYRLSPLVLTSLLVLAYTLAVMPLFTPAVRQGALGQLGKRAGLSSLVGGGKPQNQFQFSWEHILANIGSSVGARPGAVVASPSKKDPDYFYTWTRDSALTVSALLPGILPAKYLRPWDPLPAGADGTIKERYEPLLREYVSAQAELQLLPNPSGDLESGGLSEPKFHVDLSAFTGSWGRPQRDGPALRALSLIPYAHYLLDRGEEEYVREALYNAWALKAPNSTIKNDLEEVGSRWGRRGFDIWEEIDGRHFYTDFVGWRAMQAGAHLARRMQDHRAGEWYAAQGAALANGLADYWTESLGAYVSSDAECLKNAKREGLDAQVLLAFVHAGDAKGAWSAAAPRVLSTLRAYAQSFDGLYAINPSTSWTEGRLVGRYKEDVYDGVGMSAANPWFICTHAVATILWRARATFAAAGVVEVQPESRAFWADITGAPVSNPKAVWRAGEPEFAKALEGLDRVAESYAATAADYYDGGHMAEQIQKDTGRQTGAKDLTWSYASFLEQERARDASKAAAP